MGQFQQLFPPPEKNVVRSFQTVALFVRICLMEKMLKKANLTEFFTPSTSSFTIIWLLQRSAQLALLWQIPHGFLQLFPKCSFTTIKAFPSRSAVSSVDVF